MSPLVFLVCLVAAVMADQPAPPEPMECQLGDMRVMEHGATWNDGCETCTCSFGAVECSEGTPCCLYVEPSGETGRALVYEAFYDGCNSCHCSDHMKPACTRMLCPWKCSYKNWDLIPGYAEEGDDSVPVYDEMDNCLKICSCEEYELSCDEGVESCIVF